MSVSLEVAHLGFTYDTVDAIDQDGILKPGRISGVRRLNLLGRDNFIFASRIGGLSEKFGRLNQSLKSQACPRPPP